MAVTYFGECDSAGTAPGGLSHSGGFYTVWNSAYVYTCPGSGNQDVQDLSAYMDGNTGSPAIRVGVYTADGATLMAEGNAVVALSVLAGVQWYGHLSPAAITQYAPLVGGSNYRLIVTPQTGGLPEYYYLTGSANDDKYNTVDYSAGFPTPAPSAGELDFGGLREILRCGVQPAAAAGRTTKNTRVSPLGTEIGMGWRMDL